MGSAPARVLVVDDEPKIVEVVSSYLRKANYEPIAAACGEEAMALFETEHPSLIILDLMLPDVPGEEVCRRSGLAPRVPIIMLTARVEDADALTGFSLGADDYVTKPFSPRQLMARVEAVLRRAEGVDAPTARLLSYGGGDLLIDDGLGAVKKAGKPVALTPSEFRILRLLAGNPGRVFSRQELISRALRDDFDGYDRAVDAHVKNVRHKIETNSRAPRYIQTVHGMGYRFRAEADA